MRTPAAPIAHGARSSLVQCHGCVFWGQRCGVCGSAGATDTSDTGDTGDAGAASQSAVSSTAAVLLQKLSTWEQTLLAAQQLGIIVGVALLVGGGFMLMVGIELTAGWALEKVYKLCGKKISEDPEDPAALVGSVKRYK